VPVPGSVWSKWIDILYENYAHKDVVDSWRKLKAALKTRDINDSVRSKIVRSCFYVDSSFCKRFFLTFLVPEVAIDIMKMSSGLAVDGDTFKLFLNYYSSKGKLFLIFWLITLGTTKQAESTLKILEKKELRLDVDSWLRLFDCCLSTKNLGKVISN
jgi:hypothetical protein